MASKPESATPYVPSLPEKALVYLFKGVNKLLPWHRLPTPIAVLNLSAFRYELRQHNLFDTYPSPDYQGTPATNPLPAEFAHARESDGLFNDVGQPKMGCAGMRFGRNVNREHAKKPSPEELMRPNPRVVSEVLLKRDEFKPATSLNLLAAAWIQFQVHDWFQHTNSTTEKYNVKLPPGDTWSDPHMTVEATLPDTPLDSTDTISPAYANENTHWWDGSQLYGSSEAATTALRGDAINGKLAVDSSGIVTYLPRDAAGIPLTGFTSNWWLGLELLHTLFVLEHNAICDALHAAHPSWPATRLFDTARLVNCALMAKIHTTEWTPALLGHPALDVAMHANWWGLLGERLHALLPHLPGESLSGIPGSGVAHHGAPYSLTEEFVAVYRLHSLVPDAIPFVRADTGAAVATYDIADVAFEHARAPLTDHALSFADILYSFATTSPGAITLNNMPAFLRNLHTPDARHIDLATLDVLRDRERGVPRYNAFRVAFHMPPASSFLTLTGGDTAAAGKLASVYDGVDDVDLLVGCLAEPLPKGFAFSDTAFRVFILMASRRLKSDRFIGGWEGEKGEEGYGEVGMKWVQGSGMREVVGRHFPGLLGEMGGGNVFAPWKKVGKA